jgi:hypothetical protein
LVAEISSREIEIEEDTEISSLGLKDSQLEELAMELCVDPDELIHMSVDDLLV